MATFAERLKELREERHLEQEELGAELDVSKNTVYRWEDSSLKKNMLCSWQTSFMYIICTCLVR